MIVAAAIRMGEGDVVSGIPFTERHHHIIQKIAKERNIRPVKGIQGFLTDKGLFLNREDAANHALECGQIVDLKFHSRQLFSEDMW